MSETPVKPETEEIDLLELAKKIWAKRRFIIKYALIGAVAGLVIGFSLPKEYTSSVKMAPEEGKSNKTSNMAGLAALAGFDLSGAGGVDGINLMLYPDVVQSTPFIVELSQIPVQPKKSGKLSLYDYIGTELSSPWWGYIISAPAKVIGWVMSIGQEKEAVGSGINPKALTREQAQVLEGLSKRINISVDKKTGVITASSTMQDPVVAAAVTDSTGSLVHAYRGLTHFCSDCHHLVVNFLRSQLPFNHLYQFHHRYRVKEVHSDHFLRTAGCGSDFRDRKRRSIRGQDRLRFTNSIQSLEYLVLRSHILGNHLDH